MHKKSLKTCGFDNCLCFSNICSLAGGKTDFFFSYHETNCFNPCGVLTVSFSLTEEPKAM